MLKRIVFIALVLVVAPGLGSLMVVGVWRSRKALGVARALDRDPFMHEVE
jgi:hypothetical protein